MRHSIRDIDTFETLLGMNFSQEQRKKLDKTVKRFPLSITPYYLSLIDTDDLENDPIWMQSFPRPTELIHIPFEMTDMWNM